MKERQFLELRLAEWLRDVHLADPLRFIRPPDVILSTTQRAILARFDPKKIKNAQDVVEVLEESADWGTEWAVKIFNVITQFNIEYSEQLTTQQKRTGNRV